MRRPRLRDHADRLETALPRLLRARWRHHRRCFPFAPPVDPRSAAYAAARRKKGH